MKTPVAYEWHNLKTGHCYVDYIRHPDLEFDGEYTKTPLYKIEEIEQKESKGMTAEEILKNYLDLKISEELPKRHRLILYADEIIEAMEEYAQSRQPEKPMDEEIEKLLDQLLNGQYAESQIDDYLARKRILEEWIFKQFNKE
jgi:hypothetical protein